MAIERLQDFTKIIQMSACFLTCRQMFLFRSDFFQLDARYAIGRIDSQCFGIVSSGFLEVAYPAKGESEIVMSIRMVWLQPDDFRKMGDSFLVFSLAEQRVAEIVL